MDPLPRFYKTFIIFFPFLLLSLPTIITQSDLPLYNFCSDNTTSTAFFQNLNRVLSSISTNAVGRPNKFYDNSEGQGQDHVFATFLCSADRSDAACQACAQNSTQEILKLCPTQKTAIVWYDQCVLRYSDQTILSIVNTLPAVYMWNMQNNTIGRDIFRQTLNITLMKSVNKAAGVPQGAIKFAVDKANLTAADEQTVYTLAQCTPDLSGNSCRQCLEAAVSRLSDCCYEKKGGRVLSPSCNVRFETYQFYNETGFVPEVYQDRNTATVIEEVNPTSPAPAPPQIPPPTPLAQGGRGGGETRIRIAAGVSVAVAVGVVLLLGCSLSAMCRRTTQKQAEKDSQEVRLLDMGRRRVADDHSGEDIKGEMPVSSKDLPMIPFDTLQEATNCFSDEAKLGEGGFGSVYKGVLQDGQEIAVKRLSGTSGQGLEEFMNEVTLIARLQHRNLVRLQGCCLEKTEKLLIYEYMVNKSLDFFLFDSTMAIQLDWQRRVVIINGIAKGLLYLHEDSRLRVIHRDLKASNVLLDHDMNPKISDFGMARIFGGNDSKCTNRIVGTYGYMSPEYAMEGLFSVKSDVFSFGVLMLEIISGRRNNRFYLSEEGESLITFAWKLWCEGKGLELMEATLVNSSVGIDVLKCIHIGLLCVQDDPAERPTMSSVVVMLASDGIILAQPRMPAFYVTQFLGRSIPSSSSSAPNLCSTNEVTLSNVSPR